MRIYLQYLQRITVFSEINSVEIRSYPAINDKKFKLLIYKKYMLLKMLHSAISIQETIIFVLNCGLTKIDGLMSL